MINLLPPQGKKQVIREYWLRIAACVSFMVAGVLLLVSVFFLPAYFYVTYQMQAFANLADANDRVEQIEKVEQDFVYANEISNLLLATPAYVTTADITNFIWELETDNIRISTIEVITKDAVVASALVGGIADTREALVAYRDLLQAHEYVSTVELPISNLAKSEKIPFQIEITTSELVQTPL